MCVLCPVLEVLKELLVTIGHIWETFLHLRSLLDASEMHFQLLMWPSSNLITRNSRIWYSMKCMENYVGVLCYYGLYNVTSNPSDMLGYAVLPFIYGQSWDLALNKEIRPKQYLIQVTVLQLCSKYIYFTQGGSLTGSLEVVTLWYYIVHNLGKFGGPRICYTYRDICCMCFWLQIV